MPLASESITREALIKELNEHEYSAVTTDVKHYALAP